MDRFKDPLAQLNEQPALFEPCWMCRTGTCSSATQCIVNNHYDAEAYACLAQRAGLTCDAAVSVKPPNVNLMPRDKDYVRYFFRQAGEPCSSQ